LVLPDLDVSEVRYWALRLEVGWDVYLVERLDEISWGVPARTLALLNPCAASRGVEVSWDLAVVQRESANRAGQQLDCGEVESSLHYIQVNVIEIKRG
jgi:hypothetical protein